MSSAVEDAIEQLEWFAEDFPDAVRLARLASLATRIEPNLLRRLRVDLLPDVDVGAEADLWFGPLIESSGTDSIVLDATVADLLRADLARESELLDRVAQITRDAHVHLAPALRLEEDVITLALRGGEDAATAIDLRLRAALRAMTENAERAGEIARWVMRAWPRLPDIVRTTRSGTTLALASTMLLRRRSDDRPLDAEATLDDVSWLFPDDALANAVALAADLRGGYLRFAEHTRTVPLIVPATDPPLVELRWESEGISHHRLAEATPGTTVSLGPDVTTVSIFTLAGTEYVLTVDTTGDPAAPEQVPPWVELPDHEVVSACVRVMPIESEAPTEATGFWITSQHIVTARSAFVGQRTLIAQSGSRRSRGDVLNADDSESVLVIAVSAGDLDPAPVPFATPGFSASRATPDDGFDIEIMEAVIIGTIEGERGAVRGTTRIDQIMPPTFIVHVEGDQPVPHGFVGGPVIIDGKVRGLVTGIEYDAAERRTTLAVASGSLIQQAVASATQPQPVQYEQQDTVAQSMAQSTAPAAGNSSETTGFEQPTSANVGDAQDQTAASPPASGYRFARVLIVANDDDQSDRIIRSLIDGGQGTLIGPHRALWWARGGSAAPSLEAGVVLQAARTDPLWPVTLDLMDAGLIVMTQPESDDSHGRVRRDVIVSRAGSTPLLTGEAVELAAEPQRRAPSKLQVETGAALREAILSEIDWSRQPEVGKDAFQRARSMAERELQPDPPVVRLEEHLEGTSSRLGTDWFPQLGPLAGQRTVEFASVVFRDPDFFADIVLAMSGAIAGERQYGLPAMPIDNLERHLWQTLGERLGSIAVKPADLVRAVSAELENAGSAVTISTDSGPVVVLPYLMEDRAVLSLGRRLTRVLRATWTGVTEAAFVPLLAFWAWSDGTIEEIVWDGLSGHGSAFVRRDGMIRIEATRDRVLAELTVSLDDTANWFDLPAEVRSIRKAIEDVLSRNASLSIDEDPLPGGGTHKRTPTFA